MVPTAIWIFTGRAALCILFVVAASAKALSREKTRTSLAEFGLPTGMLAVGSVVLPLAELGVAVLLVPASTARVGGTLAAVLLVTFGVAMLRLLGSGEQPNCNCFGQLQSRPIGVSSVVRNGILAAIGIDIAVAGPGPTIGRATANLYVHPHLSGAAIVLAFIAQSVLLFQLFRQNARLMDRIEKLENPVAAPRHVDAPSGIPVGKAAPEFAIADLDGNVRTLGDLLASGRFLALAFSDPNCAACTPVLSKFAELYATRSDEFSVALVTRGSVDDVRTRINGYRFDAVLLQDHRELAEEFRVPGVPSAVVVSPDGRIASSVAMGANAIDALFARTFPSRTTGTADATTSEEPS